MLKHDDLPPLLPMSNTLERDWYHVKCQQTKSIVQNEKSKHMTQCELRLLNHILNDGEYSSTQTNADGPTFECHYDFITITASKKSVGVLATCCFMYRIFISWYNWYVSSHHFVDKVLLVYFEC